MNSSPHSICQDLHSYITCWWISSRLAFCDFRYFVCGSSLQIHLLYYTRIMKMQPRLFSHWTRSQKGPGHPQQTIPALSVFLTIWVSQSQACYRAPSRGFIKLTVTARDVLVVWCSLISFVHTFSLKKHIYFWWIRLFYSCVQDPERPEGHMSQFGM